MFELKEKFEIGIITGVQGVRGEVKIFPYTGSHENLIAQKYFITNDRKLIVEKSRQQGKFIIIKFAGIDNREKAIEMKGEILCILRENAAALSKGEYYMEDILGCSVFENDEYLGKITDIIETGGNDVYSLVDDDGKEMLIPAIKSVVMKIDIENRRISIKIPEGLNEDDYI